MKSVGQFKFHYPTTLAPLGSVFTVISENSPLHEAPDTRSCAEQPVKDDDKLIADRIAKKADEDDVLK